MTTPGAPWWLQAGRDAAETLMTARCVIFGDSRPVTDTATGRVTFTEVDPHADVPCRIRPAGGQASEGDEAGGAEVTSTTFIVSIPMDHSPLPAERQRLRLTSCPDDPAMVGPVFEIRLVPGGATTARRLVCELAD